MENIVFGRLKLTQMILFWKCRNGLNWIEGFSNLGSLTLRLGLYCSLFTCCRWVLLESLDKVSPGIVNWKITSKPPIKMPFRKVENCNQVVKIGKQLKFSLVNVAGNDIVQGNKKLILGMLFKISFSLCIKY